MRKHIQVITRPVRQITINTGRAWSDFRAEYERAVPCFDRLEAIGVARSGGDWGAINRLSEATAINGLVNFFTFDPSPVMHLTGSPGHAVTYLTGNIVKAAPGLGRQPSSLLYLPLRIVISDTASGEALVSIDHPADLLSAYGDPILDAAASDFCAAVAALLAHLDVPVPEELINLP